MHVIFINSQYDFVPVPQRSFGPYLLKHVLQKHGYRSQVIDFCQEFTAEQIFSFVQKFVTAETVCVGLSSTFWSIRNLYNINDQYGMPDNIYNAVKLIKSSFPNLKIILGGTRAGLTNIMLEDVDVCFIGESEDTLIDVLDHWTKGSPEPSFTIKEIINKKMYQHPINKRFDIQYCDFKWALNDCINDGETLPIETARGCVFKCKFCNYPHLGKKKFDFLKSIDLVKEHLIHNYNNFKITNYLIADDTFNDTEYKVNAFLDMVESLPFKINFVAYIRADLLYRFPGMAEKLQRAGLLSVFFGIESLHPSASHLAGKAWSGKHAREYIPHLLNNIWKRQVFELCTFLVGLPGETKDDLESTLQWANENKIKVAFVPLRLIKALDHRSTSSEFEKNSEKYGFRFDENNAWYNKDWTSESAGHAGADLNNRREVHYLGGFHFLSLMSLGYNTNEILLLNDAPNDAELKRRVKKFIDDYVDKLNAL